MGRNPRVKRSRAWQLDVIQKTKGVQETTMCMSCGCGKPNERHKPGDITQDDLEKAAKNSKIDLETVADNIHESAKNIRAGQKSK